MQETLNFQLMILIVMFHTYKMTAKFDFVKHELEALKQEGRYNYIRVIESPQGPWLTIEGKKVLNMCSNNYLGLCSDPRVIKAVQEAIEEYGVGPGAVRSIAGTMTLHRQLEQKLAEFKKTERTLVLQSGFNANLAGIGPLLPNAEAAVFTDELNHASIIDGIRLTKAKRYIYKHRDTVDLEQKLKEGKDHPIKVIITDGVFSMDGDLAPMPEIVEVAEQYGAIVMVDDAHGEGVLGDHGRGIVDHFNLHGKVDVEVGTLSKAFGVVGGYLAAEAQLIDYYEQKGRPYLFSSALTVPDTAAALKSVEILMESDELVKRLWNNAAYFKKEMQSLGFDTGISETPITPIMLGESKVAQEFSRKLFEKQVFATPIFYPTVPKGKARIRVMISAAHTKEDLDFGLKAFEEVGKELKVI